MQLKDIMVRDVITVTEDEAVANVARRMQESNIGCLVITNGGDVRGIVTDRDLTIGCLKEDHNAQLCKVSSHMSSPALIAEPGMDILDAAHLMTDKRIKRLPVVENGRLIGLVSFSDLANAMIQPMIHLMAGLGAARRVN